MTIWVDGARSKEGKAGAAAVTQDGSGGWKERRWHLGTNKEVVDAELYAITEALKPGRGWRFQPETRVINIFTDSRAALQRITKGVSSEVGQWLVRRIVERTENIRRASGQVTLRWVPAHSGIEGNQRADEAARSAAS